jgi:acetyl esterase/lipase
LASNRWKFRALEIVMAENPIVHIPTVWPLVNKANHLRRKIIGNARSFDIINWKGTPYGTHERQCLDLQELNDLCPRDGWPTILLIHGGGWVEGDKSSFSALAPLFARRKIMAVSMNYRLGPEFQWPAQLEDVLSAIDFLREQQIDLSRLALWGVSAGAHLALMAAIARPEQIKCIVTIGAPTDIENLHLDSCQEVFAQKQLQTASPIHFSDCPLPPTLMLHGEKDKTVPVSHTLDFAKQRSCTEVMIIKDGDHGLRWPIVPSFKAKRKAIDWVEQTMDMPPVGSKWKRRKKKKSS